MPRKLDENAMRRSTVPFELKSMKADDGGQFAGEFSGYAAGIHNIDRTGDMILPGAFADGLAEFIADGVVCWQHDWMTPIGAPTAASEDEYGLFTSARISRTQQGLDAMTLIRDRVIKKLSIGYRVERNGCEWVDRAGLLAYLATTNLSEQRRQGVVRQYDEMELDELCLLRKIKLYEYSPVSVPANPNAIITDAKGLLTGLTFADHSKAVLTAVQGLRERARGVLALKAERKTKLNSDRRAEIEGIASSLKSALDSLAALLTDAPGENNQEAARLYAEYLKIEARSLGVAA